VNARVDGCKNEVTKELGSKIKKVQSRSCSSHTSVIDWHWSLVLFPGNIWIVLQSVLLCAINSAIRNPQRLEYILISQDGLTLINQHYTVG
jgi:hypothetical protein